MSVVCNIVKCKFWNFLSYNFPICRHSVYPCRFHFIFSKFKVETKSEWDVGSGPKRVRFNHLKICAVIVQEKGRKAEWLADAEISGKLCLISDNFFFYSRGYHPVGTTLPTSQISFSFCIRTRFWSEISRLQDLLADHCPKITTLFWHPRLEKGLVSAVGENRQVFHLRGPDYEFAILIIYIRSTFQNDLGSKELFFSWVFSDISERNNDYSDTLDFRRGWVGVVTFFVLKVPDYESIAYSSCLRHSQR